MNTDNTPLYESPLLRSLTGPALRPGGAALTSRALSLLLLEPEAVVLDVGCGPGETLGLLMRSGYRAYGLDLSAPLLREARAHGPVIRGTAEALPFQTGTVKAIFCECMLSLAEDKGAVLAEMYRVLCSEGYLILADIHVHNPSSPRSPSKECLAGAVTLERLEALLSVSGFTILEKQDHTDALKALAAQIVFACGSMEAFRQLWQRDAGLEGRPPAFASPPQAGYALFIAQAKQGPGKGLTARHGIPEMAPAMAD